MFEDSLFLSRKRKGRDKDELGGNAAGAHAESRQTGEAGVGVDHGGHNLKRIDNKSKFDLVNI